MQTPAVTASHVAGAPRAQATAAQACDAFAARWPETVGEIEAILRLRDVAQFEASVASMRRYLDGLDVHACPEWADAVAMQRALVDEFVSIYSITHDADEGELDSEQTFAGQSLSQLRQQYIAMHNKACTEASRVSGQAWHIFKSEPSTQPAALRAQRFIINMETDASLVGRDGTTGSASTDAATFVALVETPVLGAVQGQLRTLQGQGPKTPQAVDLYVQHSLAYAQKHHAGRVVFVNAAGGQVANFSSALPHDSSHSLSASYLEFTGWADGTLVTPKIAAQYTASLMPHFADETRVTVMVVNCNAGLDRSGTMNVLLQLALEAEKAKALHQSKLQILDQGFAQIPKVVAQLKSARPHSISTFGRYMFLYQSFEAYVEMLMS